jgi:hypothetical protein
MEDDAQRAELQKLEDEAAEAANQAWRDEMQFYKREAIKLERVLLENMGKRAIKRRISAGVLSEMRESVR